MGGKTATAVLHESHREEEEEASFTNVCKAKKTLINLFLSFKRPCSVALTLVLYVIAK